MHLIVPKAQKPTGHFRELTHLPQIWHSINAIAKHPAQPAGGEAWRQVDVEASIPATIDMSLLLLHICLNMNQPMPLCLCATCSKVMTDSLTHIGGWV